jgi:nucleotide-binding universal stress UspA family protein
MYKSILVPLDGSELAECSLQHVQAIAQGCNVPAVTLLTVIEPSPEFVPHEAGSQSQVEAMFREHEQRQAQAIDNANKYLAKASGSLSKENVAAKADVVLAPRGKGVAEVILEYAQNSATDLIIMSTHGRSGIARWAMGSIADRVVRSSTVPVLIVASPGCRL